MHRLRHKKFGRQSCTYALCNFTWLGGYINDVCCTKYQLPGVTLVHRKTAINLQADISRQARKNHTCCEIVVNSAITWVFQATIRRERLKRTRPRDSFTKPWYTCHTSSRVGCPFGSSPNPADHCLLTRPFIKHSRKSRLPEDSIGEPGVCSRVFRYENETHVCANFSADRGEFNLGGATWDERLLYSDKAALASTFVKETIRTYGICLHRNVSCAREQLTFNHRRWCFHFWFKMKQHTYVGLRCALVLQ